MIIRSISGVRGLTATHLTPLEAEHYAAAVHELLPAGTIVIGRDSRPSGTALEEALVHRLILLNREIILCGIVPTPTVQYLVESTGSAGGIIITASHNPAEWNGLKFVRQDGTFFLPDECAQLFRQIDHMETLPDKKTPANPIIRTEPDANQKHIDKVLGLSCIDAGAIRDRQFKIAIDAVNGAGSVILPELMKALGCTVIPLNCESSGRFTRGTEPLPENLGDISRLVRETGADAGFAVDPDADRLAIVDENGKPLGEEYTLVLAADGYIRSTGRKETFVVNLSTSLALQVLAGKQGCQVLQTAVGEINVVNGMQRINANLGGEGNGGVILREAHLGRDSLVGAAMVLNRMAQDTLPISQIKAGLPQFIIVKSKVTLENISLGETMRRVQEVFDKAEVNTEDGIKFSWDDRWIHLRKSNTEPIMRIYAEAPTASLARDLINKVKSIIS